MDLLVNSIENLKSVEVEKPSLTKKDKVATVDLKKSDQDEVNISADIKSFQEKLVEAEKYKEDLEQAETLSEEEISEFQEKIQDFQQNYEGVEDKIVYSLMTLPAFHGGKTSSSSANLTVEKEIEELKKIEQDLTRGGKIDEVLEEAIEYLMKSLLSE